MKLDYCAIGMRIKERRTKKEWSQEMLASTVGHAGRRLSAGHQPANHSTGG